MEKGGMQGDPCTRSHSPATPSSSRGSIRDPRKQQYLHPNKVVISMARENQTRWAQRINEARENLNLRLEAEIGASFSIYKIPPYMVVKNSNYTAYQPLVISIGPIHYGEEHLSGMENAKDRALIHLLFEIKKDVEDFKQNLRPLINSLMNAYEELDQKWRQDEESFLALMVRDGCFIIEILRANFPNYALNDPVFSEERQQTIINFIKRDMLLMENQLPLIILEQLLTIIVAATKVQIDIKDLLHKFFLPNKRIHMPEVKHHILDVIRISLIQGSPRGERIDICPSNDSRTMACNSRSVTALHNAGINFKRSTTDDFQDIIFENRNLHLPTLTIEQNSESMFLNAVAFEQLHSDRHRLMSSYFLFMGGLLTTPEDVKLLKDKEIIQSFAMSDVAILDVIKNVIRGLFFNRNDGLYQVQQNLNNYCLTVEKTWKRRVERWFSKLRERYFESPWTIIGVIGGFIMLVATVGGTVYSALAYYGRK